MSFDLVSYTMGMANGTGRGGEPSTLWILNPDVMDIITSASPYMNKLASTSAGDAAYAATLAFCPFVEKLNSTNVNDQRIHWIPQKGTYDGVANTAFFGRYGLDRSGIIFATKVKAGVYTNLHIQLEVSSGAYPDPMLQLRLVPAVAFTSDVDPANAVFTQTIANGSTVPAGEVTIPISTIESDFYVGFFDYSGFSKLRAIYAD